MPKSRARMRAPLALVLLMSLSGCANSSTPLGPQAQVYHVLFIGNSLTYTNDLPGTVGLLASVAGDSFEVESVAYPNYALIDHIHGPSDAVGLIRNKAWDYVVLQQGP